VSGELNALDWLVIVGYLAGVISLGIWFGRQQRNTRDYFLGGRNIRWWGIGASIVATETSALTIIGVPALSFGGNMMFLQMIVGYVIARILLAIFLVPRYMKGEIYSPYQLLQQHLGNAPRNFAGGCFLLAETFSAGVRVYVACIPIQLMLGESVCSLGGLIHPILGAILLFVVLSLTYTYVGGVKAVVWTDAVQMVLFVVGGLFVLFYIPTLIDGGWGAAMEMGGRAGKLDWFNPQFGFSAPFNIWMGVVGGTVMVMATHGAQQLIVQRVLACANVTEGRKALVFSAVLILPIFLIFLLVGVLLWVFYQGQPFQIPLPESQPGIKANDFVLPIFMITEVPHVVKGFLLVGILAAAMSSISSSLSALASVSTMDFVRHAFKGGDDAFYLRLSRYSTLGWAFALVGVAWLTREAQFVLNAAFSLMGLISGALLGGVLIALFGKWIGSRATVVGMASSVVAMNLVYWPPKFESVNAWWAATFGGELYWPWFTLLGTVITISVASGVRMLSGSVGSKSGQA
jgi:SSS family transporter